MSLGHVIRKNEIAIDLAKIKAVTNWPKPMNVSNVMSFLGLAGYCRRFV